MTTLSEILAQINSEFKIDSQGKAFVSIRGAARLADVDEKSLRYSFQGAEEKPSRMSMFLSEKGFKLSIQEKWSETGIPEMALICLLEYYAFHAGRFCKEKAYQSLSILRGSTYVPRQVNYSGKEDTKLKIVSTKCFKQTEKYYQKKLAKVLQGKMEVQTVAGAIDILTNTELIEVKKIYAWKEALGQVLAYGTLYPSHQKRIHLFGETQESYLEMIEVIAGKYKVIVTWEP